MLAGCDGLSRPKAEFDPIAVRRPLNLVRQLGPDFTLAGSADTLHLRLTFDVPTGRNIFTTSANDTVLVARIFRFRGIHYFVQTSSDGADWVHATRIRRGQITGFNNGYEQMQALSKHILAGNLTELIRFRNITNDSLRLHFDKRQLHSFYAAQLDSLPVYELLANRPSSSSAEASASPASLVLGPYPNPASKQVTLDFATEAYRLIYLYNDQGSLLRTISAVGLRLTFSVADLSAGSYVLRVSQPNSKAAPLTRRLLVER